MVKFEQIYDIAEGNFGLVTFAEAKGIGVSIRELSRWVRCGRLEKVARGVYRISRFPFSEYDPYATAVETIGPEAFLYGESVLGMLHLVPTNPTSISVASPKRVRRTTGNALVLYSGKTKCTVVNYNGVRSQHLAEAIRACRYTVRPDRRIKAAEEGRRQGFLGVAETEKLLREIKDETSA